MELSAPEDWNRRRGSRQLGPLGADFVRSAGRRVSGEQDRLHICVQEGSRVTGDEGIRRQFQIRHIGVYRHAQHLKEVRRYEALGLNVSGFRLWRDGGRELTGRTPCFSLALEGEPYEVDFGPDRENWVVIFSGLGFRRSSAPGFAETAGQEERIRLPLLFPLRPEEVPGWRLELERMRAAWAHPTPQNRLRAELGLVNVFRQMLDGQTGRSLGTLRNNSNTPLMRMCPAGVRLKN